MPSEDPDPVPDKVTVKAVTGGEGTGTVAINGEGTEIAAEIGDKITLTADGEGFVCWKRDAGTVVSTERE